MIRQLVPLVRLSNASVVVSLPRSRALRLSPQTKGWISIWAAWHRSKAQALKGALQASLPLWKAFQTHCVLEVSIPQGRGLSQWGGLTSHGRTTSGREQKQDVLQQFWPDGCVGSPACLSLLHCAQPGHGERQLHHTQEWRPFLRINPP